MTNIRTECVAVELNESRGASCSDGDLCEHCKMHMALTKETDRRMNNMKTGYQ